MSLFSLTEEILLVYNNSSAPTFLNNMVTIVYNNVTGIGYYVMHTLIYVISFLIIILSSALLSLVERNVVALIQRRLGPSIVGGSFGIIQPIIDGFKLLFKEVTTPDKSNKL